MSPAGSFVFVPPGDGALLPERRRRAGADHGAVHALGMERFFDRFAAPPAGPVDPGAFGSIGAEVGMEVVGPPMAVTHPV